VSEADAAALRGAWILRGDPVVLASLHHRLHSGGPFGTGDWSEFGCGEERGIDGGPTLDWRVQRRTARVRRRVGRWFLKGELRSGIDGAMPSKGANHFSSK
jgi:hypothetical protein